MVTLKNVSKQFGDKLLFSGINASYQAGSFVGVTGPSGCGKSTLLSMIGALDHDYGGQIVFRGKSLKNLNSRARQLFFRNDVSFIFQDYALIKDQTVEENLRIALYADKGNTQEKIKSALTEVGLDSKILRQTVYMLSGGEQQRVALARVLLKPSKLILADEPTGNLDDDNSKVVLQILEGLANNGKVVLMATHERQFMNEFTDVLDLSKSP